MCSQSLDKSLSRLANEASEPSALPSKRGLAGKEAGIVVRWLGLKYIQSGWGMGQNLVLPNCGNKHP